MQRVKSEMALRRWRTQCNLDAGVVERGTLDLAGLARSGIGRTGGPTRMFLAKQLRRWNKDAEWSKD